MTTHSGSEPPEDVDSNDYSHAAPTESVDSQEVLQLRTENDKLRNKVALYRYGMGAMNRMLAEVNDTGITEVCKCTGCYLSKRFSELCRDEIVHRLSTKMEASASLPECILKKCLLWHCCRLGLTYEILDCESPSSDEEDEMDNEEDEEEEADESCDDENDASSVDSTIEPCAVMSKRNCHIVVIDRGEGLWEIEYGKKLAVDGFHRNNDIDKLKALFRLLSDGEEFFVMDGKNYFHIADHDDA
jgi:hypothetical protein